MAVKHKTKPQKSAEPPVAAATLKQFFHDMLLIRRFEERAGQLYGMGLIGGFCHLYIGQEAVVVGLQAAIEEGDTIVTSYRDHGHMLACGMDPKGVMAELAGRRDGYSRGKGGSMHMFSREKNFFGGHGIVGAQVPIGTGLGFAHRYRDDGRISVTFLGDGAINQGQVYESFNMASLWKLPVVYVIENNRYGMGTSVDRASARTDLFHRGVAYGIPGEQVDGMDAVAVYEAGVKAAEHARSGEGPIIIEMLTYRYRGHSMSDPAKYRTRDEVNKMRSEHDPIDHLRARLIENGVATEAALTAVERKVREIVAEAAQFAQDCPEPDPAELWTDVLAEAHP
ncbi:MAG TPA: pyruvate dehydrogenase (acetyl-transferring) E1 component subunit alpha [Stellaceae bacterium]|jgi:pyruvate dehydrogenase E1 component alpha subunit|nr:pyruvate dehydrogenase (acetyl-transferring) E1 component subunit alpha [Stellaceae bacterium]